MSTSLDFPTFREWKGILQTLAGVDNATVVCVLRHISTEGLDYSKIKTMDLDFRNIVKSIIDSVLHYRKDLEKQIDDLYAENMELQRKLAIAREMGKHD